MLARLPAHFTTLLSVPTTLRLHAREESGWSALNAALQCEETRQAIAAAGLSSAMLASSLRRLPANEYDATILADTLRSPALQAVLSAAISSSSTTPAMPVLAAMVAAAADPTLGAKTLSERAVLISERRRDGGTLYPVPSDWKAQQAPRQQKGGGAAVACTGEPAIDPSRAAASRQGDSEWANEGP